MPELAELIYDFRLRHGLTQAELAAHLRVKRNTVSQYETGSAKPSLEVLARLQNIFPGDQINKPLMLLISSRVRTTFPLDRPDEQPSVTWNIPGKFDEDVDDILERLRGHGAAPGIIRLMKAYRRTGNDQSYWGCFDSAASFAEYSLLGKLEVPDKKRRRGPQKRAKETG